MYDLHFLNFSSTYFFTDCDSFVIEPIICKNDNLPCELLDTIISPISFDIFFKDCYNNWYYQILQIDMFHNIIPSKSLKEKTLSVSIKDFKVLSAPIEIPYVELPWNKDDSKNCVCM